jgi:hypothetical protein
MEFAITKRNTRAALQLQIQIENVLQSRHANPGFTSAIRQLKQAILFARHACQTRTKMQHCIGS